VTLGAAASQGKTYVVKLHLDESQLALRSGMTCRVEIVVGGSAQRASVPLQAVLNEQSADSKDHTKNVNYVFAIVDGKAKKKVVELGLSDDANQEVTKGLAVGETIAVGPARMLRELHDGDPVVAKKAELKVASGAKT
jgi:HlyD family secretion protein